MKILKKQKMVWVAINPLTAEVAVSRSLKKLAEQLEISYNTICKAKKKLKPEGFLFQGYRILKTALF